MTAAPGIRIDGARLRFAADAVFDALDMNVPAARWTCLLGPSGVGKTSLLRLVAELPAEGAEIAGRVTADDGAPLAGRIAYMAQRDLLLPWASALDNVLLGPRLRGELRGAAGRAHRERALELLAAVGLAARADALPAELSGGMRQRTALARTLFEDKPVVLMDEPFSALDAVTRHRLQALAVDLLAGRTVLLVTHDPLEALRVGDRVEVLTGRPARLAPAPIEPAGPIPRATDDPAIARLHGRLLERLAAEEGPAPASPEKAKGDAPKSGGGGMTPGSFVRPITLTAGLLLLWQAAVWISGAPPFILPGPAAVGAVLIDKAPLLAHHGLVTASEILMGLGLGTLLGVLSALSLSAFRPARRWLMPVMVISQALPVFALAPLLTLWFGYGMASKVVMATLIIYFPVTSAFYDGLRRTDPGWLDLAQTMGATKRTSLLHLRLPAALPAFTSGLRVAAAVAPIGAVVGEWVGSSAGLGYLMLHANARMQISTVFAALVVLAAFSLILFFLVDRGGKRLVRWQSES